MKTGAKAGGILTFFGIFLIPVLLVTVIFAPITAVTTGLAGLSEKQDDPSKEPVTLVDYVVFGESSDSEALEEFQWAPYAQKDLKELRSTSNPKETDDKTKYDSDVWIISKDFASAFCYVWYIEESESPVPKGASTDWQALIECFTSDVQAIPEADRDVPEDLESYDEPDNKLKLSKSSSCWTNIEQLYGLSVKKKTNIVTLTNAVFFNMRKSTYYSSGGDGGELLENYEENTFLKYGTAECDTLWNQIASDWQNSGKAFTGNWGAYPGEDWKQCTTFASWRLWIATGKVHGTAGGNGKYVAKNLCDAYPDEYTYSTEPAGGAIFSKPETLLNQYGHVGYVEKVEGDYMWISDGNISPGHSVRINYKVLISDYTRIGTKFANPK